MLPETLADAGLTLLGLLAFAFLAAHVAVGMAAPVPNSWDLDTREEGEHKDS